MKHERQIETPDGGPDGPHGRQRARGRGFHALLERRARRGPGPHQGGRNQPDASRRRPRAATTGSTPATTSGAAPMYVKHNGDVYPCCQSYMLDGAPVGRIGEQSLEKICNGEPMRACAASTRRARGRDRHLRALLHHHSASAAGHREPVVARQNRPKSAALGGAPCLSRQTSRPLAEPTQASTASAAPRKPRPNPKGDRHSLVCWTKKGDPVTP